MLVTEKEAKQKDCCGPPSVQSAVIDKHFLTCRGPDCMAWRWYDFEASGTARRGYCGYVGLKVT